jgi:SAM-dependent methyltransferase
LEIADQKLILSFGLSTAMHIKSDHSPAIDSTIGEAGLISRETCPLCVSTDQAAFRTVARLGSNYEIVKCSRCGFVYAATARFDTADHGEISTLYWRFRSRHHQIRRLIHLHLKPGSQVVEIGCGRGELGFIMRNDPYSYTGYEPASGLSKFGQQHGVNVVHDFFKRETAPSADAIIIDNVLEHVLDPEGLLADAVMTLRSGGLAVVIVPNRDDLRQLVPGWRDTRHWIPPDHINYFSMTDIKRMFAKCGLDARSFGFHALAMHDYRYFPRAALETMKIFLLGHNVYAVKRRESRTGNEPTQ